MVMTRQRWAVIGRSSTRDLGALGGLGVAWLAISTASWAGVLSLSLINQVVLFGIAVVVPLSVGGRSWWWGVAAAGALTSYMAPTGSAVAGVAIAPFAIAAVAAVLVHLTAAGPLLRWGFSAAAEVLAPAYAVVAAGALAQSRLEIAPFDLYEPIIELTAVHYMFAGSAALALARATLTGAVGGWRNVAVGAVVLTGLAPPIVAAGFVTGSPVPQIGGAVLMTLGVWLTAVGQLHAVAGGLRLPLRGWAAKASTGLLAISGLAVWVPMVLAVAWAAGEYWQVPALSIRDMARTHGLANAFTFCFCGLLARHLDRHADL